MTKKEFVLNLISRDRFIFIFFSKQSSHSKNTVTMVTKSKGIQFYCEQTRHLSNHGSQHAEACLRTAKIVTNPCSINLNKIQYKILRKFIHFSIRNQNVVDVKGNN